MHGKPDYNNGRISAVTNLYVLATELRRWPAKKKFSGCK